MICEINPLKYLVSYRMSVNSDDFSFPERSKTGPDESRNILLTRRKFLTTLNRSETSEFISCWHFDYMQSDNVSEG
jgi:hypothetical protein